MHTTRKNIFIKMKHLDFLGIYKTTKAYVRLIKRQRTKTWQTYCSESLATTKSIEYKYRLFL
jgi:hypothetical protein